MKSFVLQKSANNELRLGWQDLPRRTKKQSDSEQTKRLQSYAEQVALAETEVICVGERCYLIDRVSGCSIMTQDEAVQHELRRDRALDIISDFQHVKKVGKNDYKPGWGIDPKITRFGKYARHTILEAGAVSSRRTGCDGRGVEVTLTLPSSSRGAFRALSRWSGYAVNRILQVIRRRRQDIDWFYVWELQKRGALHLHMALSGLPNRELLQVGREVRKTWFRVLEEIGRREGADMFLRGSGYGRNTYKQFLKGNRVAEIQKSLAAYFAKYVSKAGSGKATEALKGAYPPSRWWGISRKLLRKVKEERLNVRFTCVSEEELVNLLSIAEGFVRRHNPVRGVEYSFELSHGEGCAAKAVGFGQRFVYWFDDTAFSSLQVWLPQLLRFLSKYCSNAVIEGDTDWALHTPAWR